MMVPPAPTAYTSVAASPHTPARSLVVPDVCLAQVVPLPKITPPLSPTAHMWVASFPQIARRLLVPPGADIAVHFVPL